MDKITLEQIMATSLVTVVDFTGITVSASEVERLLFDPANKDDILGEAMTGAEFQVYFGVRLERPTPEFNDNGTPKAGFDYWITDTGERLDFLFSMYGEQAFKIKQYNLNFAKGNNWSRKIQTIQEHLEKADVVPMDLRHITDIDNLIRLINYVLSLPKEQQKKVVLIFGERGG